MIKPKELIKGVAHCPGVCATWQHFKSIYKDQYEFFEFIDQYDEVYQRDGNSYLGIGLAVQKSK